MFTYEGSYLATILPEVVEQVMSEEPVDCPDWASQGNPHRKEIAATIRINNPLHCLDFGIPTLSLAGEENIIGYVDEIVKGTLDWAVKDGIEKYTYHDRISRPVDQVYEAIKELDRNPDSNRAVCTTLRPEDAFLDDKPCLQHIQFKIVRGSLEMYTLWRSNDLYGGTPMNVIGLLALGKEVATVLQVPFLGYTHTANALHLYEKAWPIAESYLKVGSKRQSIPVENFFDVYENPLLKGIREDLEI